MATIAIPLAIELATQVIPLLPDIVKKVESLFGKGNGKDKLKVATDLAKTIVDQLATGGHLKGNPTLEQLTAWIQAVVDGLNATGQLGKPGNAALPVGGIGNGVEGTYIITVKRNG